MMERIGTISYNIYCNFTNYGSALQTWALHQAIKKIGYVPVLVDYCPDVLADKDPLNPYSGMWDHDIETKRMVELTLPAIKRNYIKFEKFYHENFDRTSQKYTSKNFEEIQWENLDGFVCGSDTIFCPDEFGFDDGYYANYPAMRGRSVSYAASFGDPHFTNESYRILNDRIKNFIALGVREDQMIRYLREHTSSPVKRTIDPTLLLNSEEYNKLIEREKIKEKYLLLYSRRYTPKMEAVAERLAETNGWQIVEISLRATNANRGHIMAYDAGVEEFLSLIKHSEYVVTNSYHGVIFSMQFHRPFVVFSREQCDNKINELLQLLGVSDRIMITGNEAITDKDVNYDLVYRNMEKAKRESFEFLKMELELL